MTNAPLATIDDFRDIESLNHYARGGRGRRGAGRRAARAADDGPRQRPHPGPVDAGPAGGFTTGEPWLPVNPNHSRSTPRPSAPNPDSVFHHYRRVIGCATRCR